MMIEMLEGAFSVGSRCIRKKDLIAFLLLTAALSLIVIKIFWLTYTEVYRLLHYREIFALYQAPAPQWIDILLLLIASFLIASLFSTAKTLVYGFILSFFFSFLVAVVYVFLFIWYTLGWGEIFSLGPYDWEVPLFFSILNVFRIMFPIVIAPCLVGALIAFLVRGLNIF